MNSSKKQNLLGSAINEMPALDESPIDQVDESPIAHVDDDPHAVDKGCAGDQYVSRDDDKKTDDEKLAPAAIVADEMIHHQGGCATEIIEAGEELRPEFHQSEIPSGVVFEENLVTATEGGSEVILENIATPYLDDVLQKNPECIDEQEIYNIVNEGKGSPGIVQIEITKINECFIPHTM